MAAQPVANLPEGDDWLHELMLDGSPYSWTVRHFQPGPYSFKWAPNQSSTAAMVFETIMTTMNAHMTTTVETAANDRHSRRGDGSDNRGTRHWDRP